MLQQRRRDKTYHYEINPTRGNIRNQRPVSPLESIWNNIKTPLQTATEMALGKNKSEYKKPWPKTKNQTNKIQIATRAM